MALEEMNKCTPQYIENMETVFEQCQQFEKNRLVFVKKALQELKRHLNLTENQKYAMIYKELEETISSANPEEDLKWFRTNHGPGMPMTWPYFEEYNPDLGHSIHKKEKLKKSHDSITLTHVMSIDDQNRSQDADNRRSVSSYENIKTYSADYSDEDQAAAEAYRGINPFEKERSHKERVRALFDYEAQDHDELSFRAGDELTKLEDEDDQGWCRGQLDDGQLGMFPANYVTSI